MDAKGIGELLHPVRIQVLKTLAKRGELTTRGLSETMPDVPQASLYRHLKAMLKAGILEVSQEKQVRGTTERSYRLRMNPFDEIAARMQRLDKKELLDLFTSFMIAELSDFAEYLGDDEYPVEKERVGFASNSVYLDDAELRDFVAALNGVVKRYGQTEAAPGRRLHKFSFTMIPTRSAESTADS
jgi:DNA-binding transcriptional ArsR family regulator